jgi:hypothetical protein
VTRLAARNDLTVAGRLGVSGRASRLAFPLVCMFVCRTSATEPTWTALRSTAAWGNCCRCNAQANRGEQVYRFASDF